MLGRIRLLVIPPAWADVWICPLPGGHIQAMGTDAKGRRQYRYHDVWRVHRDTPAVSRSSYVDPRIVDRYQAGLTIAAALEEIGEDVEVGQPSTQGAIELAVLALLTDDDADLAVAA